MIFAFSTSSRLASVAIVSPDGNLIWSGDVDAPQAASGACMRLLEEAKASTGIDVDRATLYVADIGPGSFTGVRVGIVLAKTFGYLNGKPCAGVTAFDLVDPSGVVILPSKRAEVFVRVPGEEPVRSSILPRPPFRGNGLPMDAPEFPHAKNVAALLDRLNPVEADRFVPSYLIEPSISVPKRPISGVNC